MRNGNEIKAWLHASIPWWAKIGLKIALSRVPVPAKAWHRLGLFVPGTTLRPARAINVFERHWRRAGCPTPGFTYLELGPGESAATAIVAWAFGAGRGTLVDAHDHAVRNFRAYHPLLDRLARHPATVRDARTLKGCESLEALFAEINAELKTDGLRGLRALPSESVDLVFSQAVLEHVPLAEFAALARELYRVQKPSGIGTHDVDFMDHLQHSLNHLRFSRAVWEKPGFASRSGFYTNRLSVSEMATAFAREGFRVDIVERTFWSTVPLARTKLAPMFRDRSEDDLLTTGAAFVLTKAPGPT